MSNDQRTLAGLKMPSAGWADKAGGAGHDVISGGINPDELYGNEGNDTISGGEDKDNIRGGEGDDILKGGRDDDTYFYDGFNWGRDEIKELKGEGKNDAISLKELNSAACGKTCQRKRRLRSQKKRKTVALNLFQPPSTVGLAAASKTKNLARLSKKLKSDELIFFNMLKVK